jgi:hypothetical protein
MVKIGGFDGSLIKLGYLPMAVNGMKYLAYRECADDPAPMDLVDLNIDAGNIVIVKIDSDPNMGGVQDHWVILESRSGNEYMIIDPISDTFTHNSAHTLSHYNPGKSASAIILAVAVFGSASPVVPPVSTAQIKGKVKTSALMKRSGPGKEYAIAGQLYAGDTVQIVDAENTIWAKLADGTYVALKHKGEWLVEVQS